ncbi:type II toxin-antitoxin system antitoxin SocA domain-containing protein [Tenacibaculum bernardetii]|uniref:type II toxin-antitoxin system antitoxin SocA domain-containing protein n=1 Tax=Tenacibaculum bernardetii TaxID=3021375 RepID=UPI0023AEF9AC|nr:type II toxin-antitoxin system antitoxin SocA domain-containing protein [Tenacibaculum bernardetii]
MPHDINIFKNIFSLLKEWYKEELNYSEDDFNLHNDFSILKLIKLQFFVAAINSKENDSILSGYDFFAMPYGPVETDTYKKIKSSGIEGLNIDRYSTKILSNFSFVESHLHEEIINSIGILKKNEPKLIIADASDLVELSHKWNSWKRNYSLARIKGNFSARIPNEEIVNDNKTLSLDLV